MPSSYGQHSSRSCLQGGDKERGVGVYGTNKNDISDNEEETIRSSIYDLSAMDIDTEEEQQENINKGCCEDMFGKMLKAKSGIAAAGAAFKQFCNLYSRACSPNSKKIQKKHIDETYGNIYKERKLEVMFELSKNKNDNKESYSTVPQQEEFTEDDDEEDFYNYKTTLIGGGRSSSIIDKFVLSLKAHKSIILIVLVLCCAGLDLGLGFLVALIPSRMYAAFGDKNQTQFYKVLAEGIGFQLVLSINKSLKEYFQALTVIEFRENLSELLHGAIFQSDNHYRLATLRTNKMDNIDQRIVQDVSLFATLSAEVTSNMIIIPVTITLYSVKTWEEAGWIGPVSIYVFFIVTFMLNNLLMAWVIPAVIEIERNEGDFRHVHSKMRLNAESRAFYPFTDSDQTLIQKVLCKVIKAQTVVANRQFFLDLSTNSWDYLGAQLTYAIVSIPIFFSSKYGDKSGTDLITIVSAFTMEAMMLVHAFTTLTDQSINFSKLLGYTKRISQLFKNIEKMEEEIKDGGDGGNNNNISIISGEDEQQLRLQQNSNIEKDLKIVIANLTIKHQSLGLVLCDHLDLTINAGHNLLIYGPSGKGKTSIFRVMRGILKPYMGGIILPSCQFDNCYHFSKFCKWYKYILYLPQVPFMTEYGLSDNIAFPRNSDFTNMKKIRELLDFADLSHLQKIQDTTSKKLCIGWFESLTRGEIQRICLLRILYNKPKFAIIDEGSNALDELMEKKFYDEFKRLGITIIAIGRLSSLSPYFMNTLEVTEENRWVYRSK